MDWLQRFNDVEYRNWNKVGHALSIMCDGVRPFIADQVQTFYGRLQAIVGPGKICTCADAPRRHDMRRCKWANAIANFHRNGNNVIWSQSDSTLWHDPVTGPWEIAKAFIRDLGGQRHARIDANTIDASGLLNLLQCCTFFTVEERLVQDVKQVRNANWGHAPRLRITDDCATASLDAIQHLLQDPALVNDPHVVNALQNIQQLGDLDVITLQRNELDLLTRYHELIQQERDALRANMEDVEDLLCEVRLTLRRLHDKPIEARPMPWVSFTWLCAVFLGVISIVANLPASFYRRMLWVFCFLCLIQMLGHGVYKEECGFKLEDDSFFPSLLEFDFSPRLDLARKHFTGRKWVFHELEKIMETQPNLTGVVIQGPPGSGKSALLAQLICSQTSSFVIHKSILGYHVCTYSNRTTQDAAKFVRNLARMIASRVVEYERLLRDDNSVIKRTLDKLCDHDASACFLESIIQPLKKIFGSDFTEYRYIILDGQDECFPVETSRSSAIVALLNDLLHEFPMWLKLVVTSRALPTAQQLSSRHISKFDLQPNDSRTLQDIDSYLTKVLYRHQSRFFAFAPRWLTGLTESTPFWSLIEELVHRSEGNFMFVKALLQVWVVDSGNQSSYGTSLPSSLAGAYSRYFERVFPVEEKFEDVRGILEILVYSSVPLTKFEVYEILKGQQSDLDYEFGFLQKFNKLSHFLLYGGDNDTVTIYHQTVTDWLKSNGNEGAAFYVSFKRGCKMLSSYFIKRYAILDQESAYRLANFISCSGMVDLFVKEFHFLASKHSNWTSISARQETILHKAAQLENPNTAKLLAPYFNFVDMEDDKGFTPAFLAVIGGHLATLQVFYDAGANISHISQPCENIVARKEFKREILLSAVSSSLSLSVQRIDQVRKIHCSSTMLHVASILGYKEIVSFLVQRGIYVNTKNAFGETPIHLAAQLGRLEILKVLHSFGAKLDELTLKYAAFGGDNIEVVDYLLRAGQNDHCPQNSRLICDGVSIYREKEAIMCLNTALHLAAIRGHIRVTEILLASQQPSVNCTNIFGYPPLHHAVYSGDLKLVELFINQGMSPDVPCILPAGHCQFKPKEMTHFERKEWSLTKDCPCGFTGLHLATNLGFLDVATTLLNIGADVDKRDCFGVSALHIAACSNQLRLCQLLKHRGAAIDARSHNGSTPYHSAAVCGSVDVFREFDNLGPRVQDSDGLSVLHYAVKDVRPPTPCENFETYKRHLGDLHFGKDKNGLFTDTWNLTWLYSLSHLLHRTPKEKLHSIVDREGKTLLHYLAERGLYAGLLFADALRVISPGDMVKVDKSGHTALDLAIISLDNYLSFNTVTHVSYNEYMTMMSGDYDFFVRLLLHFFYTDDLYKEHLCFRFVRNYKKLIKHKQRVGAFLVDMIRNLSCWNSGSLVLNYLQSPSSSFFAYELIKYNVSIPMVCGGLFNESIYHLLAYRMSDFTCFHWVDVRHWVHAYFHPLHLVYDVETKGTGPLAFAFSAIPSRKAFVDTCMDKEGYNALQRAAQGSNLAAIKMFVGWGANLEVLSPGGYDLLHLVVLYAIKAYYVGGEQGSIPQSVLLSQRDDAELASQVAIFFLQHLTVAEDSFYVACNAELTLYHLAASRGMASLIKYFITEDSWLHVVRCEDKYGVTPLYLAHLYGNLNSDHAFRHSKICKCDNAWADIASLLNVKGLIYCPYRDAERFLIYHYLYGHFQDSFRLDFNGDTFQILRTYSFLLQTECQRYLKGRVDRYYSILHSRLHHFSKTLFYLALLYPYEFYPIYMEVRKAIQIYHDLFTIESYVENTSRENKRISRLRHRAAMTGAQFVLYDRISGLDILHVPFMTNNKPMIFEVIWRLLNDILDHLIEDCAIAFIKNYIELSFKTYVKEQIPKVKIHQLTWPPKGLRFVRERMGWEREKDEHSWPVRFLVRMALNDTAEYNYLKVLNVGLLSDLIEVPT